MTETIQNTAQQISDFRERVQILQMQQTPDGLGGYTENWILQQQIWANIRMIENPVQNNPLRQEHLAIYEFFSRFITILPEQRVNFRNMQAIVKNITELDNKKKFISFIATIIVL